MLIAVCYCIFSLSVLGIAHTYVLYPLFCRFYGSKHNHKKPLTLPADNLPAIAIVFAAYNEELVIEAKLKSIFESQYPLEKINVFIGSDASTDRTEAIIMNYQQIYPSLVLQRFQARTGKTSIVNELVSKVTHSVLIMTDANVLFQPTTLVQLVSTLQLNGASIVGANIHKQSANEQGIAGQEKDYMRLENKIKQAESDLWQLVIGVEGGCYAMQRKNFEPVPKHFKVDDFYITMKALAKKQKVLFDALAICYEDVPVLQSVEFKRKVRISTGNFQNLIHFRALLWPPFAPLAFAFFSHKVLRWLTPFFIILCALSSLALMLVSLPFFYLFLIQVMLMLLPFIEKKLQTRNRIITYIIHFYVMNWALLVGFFKFINGVENSIWEPTQRNV